MADFMSDREAAARDPAGVVVGDRAGAFGGGGDERALERTGCLADDVDDPDRFSDALQRDRNLDAGIMTDDAIRERLGRAEVRQLQRPATSMTRRQLRAHKKLCADVIRNDFD